MTRARRANAASARRHRHEYFLGAALAIVVGKRTGSREVFEELLPSGVFEHLTSTPILYEIGDVLPRRELGVPGAMIEPFIAQIEALSIVVPIRNLSMGIADRKDDKFLETAVQGRANAIVTRDADFLITLARNAR
jgi:uncharacterized protein